MTYVILTLDEDNNGVKEAIDQLRKNWEIEQCIYDLHIGMRNDVLDVPVTIDNVVFHIPKLQNDDLFVLWECLWPDCHNCCDRQGRLPLTKDDLSIISRKLGYSSRSAFLKNEARISSWDERGSIGNVITTLSMISLKRKSNEAEDEDGVPIKCRFLDDGGSCNLHPEKPGVCTLYPFASWTELDGMRPVIHASFQLTGDCPGFYTDKSVDPMMKVLKEYSQKIYDYNMAVSRTTREKFGFINIVQN
ncbi:MAG: YkgJ family cysteine cluster protein [Thermoproteota archaeon]|nr:YkgJ family cysteine cluster protein [Thermoproteota archaeon]